MKTKSKFCLRRVFLPALLLEYQMPHRETVDDIVDCMYKNLMILDYLDYLQEVLLYPGEVIFAFDPVMPQQEFETAYLSVKQKYPQALMVGTPQDASWWVISIANPQAAPVTGIAAPQPVLTPPTALAQSVINGNPSPLFVDQSVVNKAVANL